jgi:hypothetical protein
MSILLRSGQEHLAADGGARGMRGLDQWAATILIAKRRSLQHRMHAGSKFVINTMRPPAVSDAANNARDSEEEEWGELMGGEESDADLEREAETSDDD